MTINQNLKRVNFTCGKKEPKANKIPSSVPSHKPLISEKTRQHAPNQEPDKVLTQYG